MSTVSVSAADVKKLRDATGAGMGDCRAALIETNGDFEGAIDFLRKKGQKVADKRSDREAKEGVVIARTSADNKVGIIVNLTSETDFVSKNEDFQQFGLKLSDLALANNCNSVEELKAVALDGVTVNDKLLEMVGKIGEKIDVTVMKRIEAEGLVAYNHGAYRVAVLVAIDKAVNDDLTVMGKDVAMQIAAMKPIALNAASISAEKVAREKDIIISTMNEDPKMAGKPADMIEKIADGKLNAFFKENTLLSQAFVKDGGITVEEYIKRSGANVTSFEREQIG
jgi:elongation factor Ts